MTPPSGGLAGAAPPAARRPVATLRGVGPKVAERLARLGIHTVEDLLFHLPSRYEDRTRAVPIGSLTGGESAVIAGTVDVAQLRQGRRRSLVCQVSDGTGRVWLRFFHFHDGHLRRLERGSRVQCYGEFRRGPSGLEAVHPEYRILDPHEPVEVDAHLTPVYPATEGLTQGAMRRLVDLALDALERENLLVELLPDDLLRSLSYPRLAEALRFIHRPPPEVSLIALASGELAAQRRLAFEELLAHHLSLRLVRRAIDHQRAAPLTGEGTLLERLRRTLGFPLTAAQERAVAELLSDLARPRPMYRLLQGDVGSGKTVVAAMCCLRAVEAGRQAALMAPTELLAEQHLRNLSAWLGPLEVRVAWLSGKLAGRQRQATLGAIARGEVDLVIGTHALFQDEVRFHDLALVVIDEQHRFGVDQRLALREKGARDGAYPHQLVMTATPIPRTLAMTAYADLDTSIIDELPPGRMPVETAVVPDHRRHEVVERTHHACQAGEQAYWVCPLIEESDALAYQAATDTAARLAEALPDLAVGLIHGRLKPAEKDAVMGAFQARSIDLLVATTVIEVGVDVPNASLMVIENAERMGLSQLHQLRGRVGRGAGRSVCVLLYQPPLSAIARERLAVIRHTTDGFEIAQRDLELRGPGEVLGTRQTGIAQLRIADLHRDRDLMTAVARAGRRLIAEHPDRIAALVQRWLGHAVMYADA